MTGLTALIIPFLVVFVFVYLFLLVARFASGFIRRLSDEWL